MSITVSATNESETEREKEIRELHSRMRDIETEYKGFSNIPPVKTHEYWVIRDKLQTLLLNRK